MKYYINNAFPSYYVGSWLTLYAKFDSMWTPFPWASHSQVSPSFVDTACTLGNRVPCTKMVVTKAKIQKVDWTTKDHMGLVLGNKMITMVLDFGFQVFSVILTLHCPSSPYYWGAQGSRDICTAAVCRWTERQPLWQMVEVSNSYPTG